MESQPESVISYEEVWCPKDPNDPAYDELFASLLRPSRFSPSYNQSDRVWVDFYSNQPELWLYPYFLHRLSQISSICALTSLEVSDGEKTQEKLVVHMPDNDARYQVLGLFSNLVSLTEWDCGILFLDSELGSHEETKDALQKRWSEDPNVIKAIDTYFVRS